MFFQTFNGWELEGTKRQKMKCPNCSHETDHMVAVIPYGPQLGVIFSKKPLAGMRKYRLVCSVCENQTKELTKEQAYSLVK